MRRVAGLVVAALLGLGGAASAQTPWAFGGADIYNSHSMLSPSSGVNNPYQINPVTAPRLAVKWSYQTHGAISVAPTVEPGGLYVPDWSGYIYKLNPATGALIWSQNLINYSGIWGSMSRSSPAIGANEIIIGDGWAHDSGNTTNPGARVYSINKTTGALLWQTVVDKTSQWSEIIGSPVIYNGLVYVGVASWEESLAVNNASFVPTFRGSVVALNETTGAIVWQFFTAPQGYTGVAVPGTNPVIWWGNHSLIVATGNNYTVPANVGKCIVAAYPTVSTMTACLDPTDYVESILSLDLKTGKLLWSRQMGGPDTWTGACDVTNAAVRANCPYYPSNDFDFASQPNVTWIPNFTGVPDDRGGSSSGNILGAGQKSGRYWALNPNNGGLYWSRFVGQGGIEWGSAVNGDTGSSVYVAVNNFLHFVDPLVGQKGVATSSNGGSWASLNLSNGAINWQIPAFGQDLTAPGYYGASPGAMAFSNYVAFAGSRSGYLTAIDSNTGNILWKFNAGVRNDSGPAIFNETVYWGVGYNSAATGNLPTLYAFSVDGH
jgi:polyvinyl alcohol dehydrogenase (cytochrome)